MKKKYKLYGNIVGPGDSEGPTVEVIDLARLSDGKLMSVNRDLAKSVLEKPEQYRNEYGGFCKRVDGSAPATVLRSEELSNLRIVDEIYGGRMCKSIWQG